MHGRVLRFPANDLQVKHEDAVKDRHQEQSDKGSHAKSTDLRVTERLPQGTAFGRLRKSQNRFADFFDWDLLGLARSIQ